MASKFDYSVNIPQPTGFGGNMMQKIGMLQNIAESQDRAALARQLAPLQLQQAELGVQSQRQQMAQSAAAAARAAESFQLNKQAALAAQERERNVANMIAEYGLDPEKDLSALAPILPTLDKNRIDALRQVEAMKIGNAFQKIDPESPDPEAIRKLAARGLYLDTEAGKRLDGLISSLPDPAREKLVDTALQVSNAGIAGNNEVAKKRLDEVATAYSGSKDARFQQLGKLMTQTLESVPENATPSYWALLGQTLMFRTGDDKAIGKFNEILTNYSRETSPEAVAEKKASTLVKEADARLKSIEADLKESGALDPEKKMSKEMQMKQAFESELLVKKYIERRDILNAVQLAKKEKTPVGDAAAITAVVKINDPTSTVSVTESGQVVGGTLPQQFRSFVARLSGDGKLSEKDRDDLIRYAETRTKSSENEYNTYLKKNIATAKKYGLDPDNIFVLPDAPTQSVLGKKATQTRQEELRGKSVPPPVPTGGTTLSIDDLLKKYGQ